jgi:hypothetical protein
MNKELSLVFTADLDSLPFSDHLQIYRTGLSIGQRLVSSKKCQTFVRFGGRATGMMQPLKTV